jgi:alpha-tubulin suppressor-like RCC1 family protein
VGPSCAGNPIQAITAGSAHACLLRADGGVFCWGRNDDGQLGDGSLTPRSLAVRVPGLAATAVAAGERHTCAVRDDGLVVCWGADDAGQLGDGGGVDRRTPVPVPGVSGAVAVSAGSDFSCAALTDGTVRCWGDDARGQLGDGSTPAAGARGPVTVFALSGVRELSGHWQHVCARRDDETLWCWGANSQGQLGDGTLDDQPKPVRAQSLTMVTGVGTGLLHTCAVTRAQGLYCWGNNNTGQLGQPDSDPIPRPTAVAGIPDPIAVGVGAQHTCAVRSSGETLCWGNNNAGQLGEGTMTALPAPVRVNGVGHAAALAAGGTFSCAETSDGAVYCWGDDHYGQLGIGSAVVRPVAAAVARVAGATSVAAGGAHTCAVASVDGGDLGVACWGADQAGQLGDNATDDRATPAETKVAIDQAAAVAAGATHTCARTQDGLLYCWGRGSSGQLGLGPGRLVDEPLPAPVPGLGTRVVSVAAGDAHTCAALADGSAACWGAGDEGEIGDGAAMDRSSPTVVSGLDGQSTPDRAAEVAAGSAHTCARLADGTLRCWGRGGDGQIGDGAAETRTTPATPALVAPGDGPGAAASATGVAAGAAHSCALDAGGQVWCWGRGDSGQLGGAMLGVLTPAPVPDVSGALAVTAGAAHTCAITAARTVVCWGANDQGQLGGGDTDTGREHVEVTGLGDVLAVSAGAAHTCAVRQGGEVWCWGSNTAGQLGDGAVLTRTTAELARISCE